MVLYWLLMQISQVGNKIGVQRRAKEIRCNCKLMNMYLLHRGDGVWAINRAVE